MLPFSYGITAAYARGVENKNTGRHLHIRAGYPPSFFLLTYLFRFFFLPRKPRPDMVFLGCVGILVYEKNCGQKSRVV